MRNFHPAYSRSLILFFSLYKRVKLCFPISQILSPAGWQGVAARLQLNKYCSNFMKGESECLGCDISVSHTRTLAYCSGLACGGISGRGRKIGPSEQEVKQVD